MVEFYGFSDTHDVQHGNSHCPPTYMLIKVPNRSFSLPGLPPSVLPISIVSFTYGTDSKKNGNRKSAKITQFPVVLAYAITDYKCQGDTYHYGVRVDLMKPSSGGSPFASGYVQFSRAKRLDHVSILRPFDPDNLRESLSDDLLAELQWQEDMAILTLERIK
jgi:hypothetical protein